MAKWKLDKSTRKEHDGGTETVTYEATIYLDADDPDDLPTLADIGALVENLTTVDEIPSTAKVGTTINVALRWTDADLVP